MISTRILLLLAAVALACIAEKRCPKVSEDSFQRLAQSTTERPHRPSLGLGQICNKHFHNNTGVRCIGDPGAAVRDCLLCCACKNGAEITYTNTTAPRNFPCVKNGKGKCNAEGECITRKR
uniref:Putative ixostatin n=1 Tax=Ixodes ricinus TaxID=34613 RepID=A0A0K8RCB2_IXORI